MRVHLSVCLSLAACSAQPLPPSLQAALPHAAPAPLTPDGDSLSARGRRGSLVTVPARAGGDTVLRDGPSGMEARVRLLLADDSPGELIDGMAFFRDARGKGGHLLLRASDEGFEDYVVVPSAPPLPELRYQLAARGAAGLRLVADTLELLDAAGTPRLRMSPPWVAGADGERRAASVDVEGCAVDRDPAPPWNRAQVAPGAAECVVVVRWDRAIAAPLVVDPGWTTTGSMSVPRSYHVQVRLPSGHVLVAGGDDMAGYPKDQHWASAELFDPATRTFAATGSMSMPRQMMPAVLLLTGRVLVIGGEGTSSGVPEQTTELYDEATGRWTATGSTVVSRNWASATLLRDGTVLVEGTNFASYSYNGPEERSAELYDPQAGTFHLTGSMAFARYGHSAVRLDDGRVLVTNDNMLTPEIYDPRTAQWTRAAAPAFRRDAGGATATLLRDGRVLVAGADWGNISSATSHSRSEIYDPLHDSWSAPIDMVGERGWHAASLLPDGRVAVVGGFDGWNIRVVPTTEIFDPAAGSWSLGPAMSLPRIQDHQATLLSTGQLLVTGGEPDYRQPATNSAELYTGETPAALCGDGHAQPPEACDGADLAGFTCVRLGYSGGTLACAADCSFDVSGCAGADAGPSDGGPADGGGDAGMPDGGAPDAGSPDAGCTTTSWPNPPTLPSLNKSIPVDLTFGGVGAKLKYSVKADPVLNGSTCTVGGKGSGSVSICLKEKVLEECVAVDLNLSLSCTAAKVCTQPPQATCDLSATCCSESYSAGVSGALNWEMSAESSIPGTGIGIGAKGAIGLTLKGSMEVASSWGTGAGCTCPGGDWSLTPAVSLTGEGSVSGFLKLGGQKVDVPTKLSSCFSVAGQAKFCGDAPASLSLPGGYKATLTLPSAQVGSLKLNKGQDAKIEVKYGDAKGC